MEFFSSESLKDAGVVHGFFTRRGGVSEGIYATLNCGSGSKDVREHVGENRRRVAAALGAPDAPVLTCHQVHGAEVVTVEAPWEMGEGPQADGMVTDRPGTILGILTADCVPVLFADRQAGVIGAAHAGWKGAHRGILGATVEAMRALQAKPENILAAIGPSIAQDSYEVGDDLRGVLLEEAGTNVQYFLPNASGRWQFDLKSYVAGKLSAAGIERINLLAMDTFSRKNDFFSYRRTTKLGEPDYGRHISAIML